MRMRRRDAALYGSGRNRGDWPASSAGWLFGAGPDSCQCRADVAQRSVDRLVIRFGNPCEMVSRLDADFEMLPRQEGATSDEATSAKNARYVRGERGNGK